MNPFYDHNLVLLELGSCPCECHHDGDAVCHCGLPPSWRYILGPLPTPESTRRGPYKLNLGSRVKPFQRRYTLPMAVREHGFHALRVVEG